VLDRLYTPEVKKVFPNVDLILGCGDLPYEYLEFLVSSFNVPLLYVPGNHDPKFDPHNPSARAEGCENIDGRVVRVKGLTIAGLGGGSRYQPHRPNQYTQEQMYWRVGQLFLPLLWHRLLSGRAPDIIIAHSPPYGIHDDDDLAHQGFKAFLSLIRFFQPRYFLHGHTLPINQNLQTAIQWIGATQIININPYQFLEVTPYGR
ncbi:MAG: metallophosphoesterase, partial [Anaerolineales bacterium]|nr:metallophosphoesterase [Anaerolineales bacterium]